MKNMFAIIACMIALSILAGCGSHSDKWQLVWEEEFNQTDHFDEATWSKIPRGLPDWSNYMSDFDSCFAMRDGKLILRGLNNYSLPNDTAPYLTGGVYTKGKVSFADGRISIRAKLNGATGAWPAFWLLPEKEGWKWPEDGEIDIMERLSYDSIAYQTVHSAYTHKLGINEPKKGSTGPIDPNDFNVYTVEMYADSLSFYINEQHTFTYPRIETDKVGQFPFHDHPFYLLLDMQLGGSWVGAVDSADLPVEMEIDWVRFYQKK